MRRSRTIVAVFLLFFLGVFAVLLAIISQLLDEGREALAPAPAPAVEVEEIVHVESDVQPVVIPRRLPIEGRVVDGDLRGLDGLELLCAGELAQTGADGRFRFPEATRFGAVPLSLRRGGDELARWDVRVGEVPGELSAGEVESAAPWRLRWSITVLARAGASGASDERREGDAPREGDAVALERVIEPAVVLVEEWGSSGAVHVEGATALPGGAELHAAVFSLPIRGEEEGDRLVAAAEPAVVEAGRFRARFLLPEGFRFYSDRYELRVSFSSVFGVPDEVERWKSEHPELPWDELEDFESAHPISIGYVEEKLADDRRIQAHYRGVLKSALALKGILDKQFRQTRRLARGWDPSLLESREAMRRAWVRTGAVDAEGGFAEEEWRRFIDEDLVPRLEELLARHLHERDSKYLKANMRMERLIKSLIELAHMESIVIYETFGLPAHRNDFYFDEYEATGDASLRLLMIKDDVEVLERYCEIVPDDEGGEDAPEGRGAGREESRGRPGLVK